MLKINSKNIELLAEKHADSLLRMIKSNSVKGLNELSYFDDILKKAFPSRPDICLEEVILARPENLEALRKEFLKKPKALFIKERYSKKKNPNPHISEETDQFENRLFPLLNPSQKLKYEVKYLGKTEKGSWSKHIFIRELGLKTCPYCNRNDIQMINALAGNKSWQSAELDHAIPKAHFPVFAISFYNLVPACKVCNKLKNASQEPIINPYGSSVDMSKQFRFGIEVKNPKFPRTSNSFELTYNYDPDLDSDELETVKETLRVFRLKEQYSKHQEFAQEIIQKHFWINDSYRKELYRKYQGVLFQNEADLFRAAFGRYLDENAMHMRPLSKFSADIENHLEGGTAWMDKIPDKDLAPVKGKLANLGKTTS